MQTIGSFQFFYDLDGTLYHALRTQFSAYEVTQMLAGATLSVTGNGVAEDIFAERFDILFQNVHSSFIMAGGGPVIRDYALLVKSQR